MLAWLALSVLVANVVTFVLFGWDKRCARLGRRRVPEATLLIASFAGGLFGGWWAMSVFRHKTVKRSFRLKMALVSICNLLWPALYLAW